VIFIALKIISADNTKLILSNNKLFNYIFLVLIIIVGILLIIFIKEKGAVGWIVSLSFIICGIFGIISTDAQKYIFDKTQKKLTYSQTNIFGKVEKTLDLSEIIEINYTAKIDYLANHLDKNYYLILKVRNSEDIVILFNNGHSRVFGYEIKGDYKSISENVSKFLNLPFKEVNSNIDIKDIFNQIKKNI